MSTRTESTTATSVGDYIEALRTDPERFSNMDKAKFKAILSRQLSGNPSRINPDLDLNTQVNCLAYNPKLEIDRANFEVGHLLGSGHFLIGQFSVKFRLQSLLFPDLIYSYFINNIGN